MGIISRIERIITATKKNAIRYYWYYSNPVKTHKHFYKEKTGKELDLEDPKDFNQKIQYLIINKYGKKEADLSDKYKVKGYVESLNIEGLNVPKTLKIYKNANDIDINELPEKFVLKCNHRSGGVFVCNDKNKFDLDGYRKVMNKMLKENFATITYEYHYKYIDPVIMAEEYIDDSKGKNPCDYKFYVFNGECERVLVCSDRANGVKQDGFDLEWNHLDDLKPEFISDVPPAKPDNFEEMIKISEQLVRKDGKVVMPFARVDLYSAGDKIYFGEYTFTPARGLDTDYTDEAFVEMGKNIDLSWYE